MKIFLVFIVVGLFMSLPGMMSKGFAAEPVKVGVIDLFRALNESDAGKEALANLESMVRSKEEVIKEKGRDIENRQAELEKKAAILSPEAKKKIEDEIRRFIMEYQRMITDFRAEIREKEREATAKILEEMRGIINEIAMEEGYTLILERGDGLILYVRENIDITCRVIKRHNEVWQKGS